MLTLLRNIPLILRWLPLVTAGVSLVEGLFGSGKSGAEKKIEVMAWLRQVSGKAGLPWTDNALEVIEKLIDLVVDALNFWGAFRKRSEVAPDELQAQQELAGRLHATVTQHVAEVAAGDDEFQRFLDSTKH